VTTPPETSSFIPILILDIVYGISIWSKLGVVEDRRGKMKMVDKSIVGRK